MLMGFLFFQGRTQPKHLMSTFDFKDRYNACSRVANPDGLLSKLEP